MSNRHPLPPTPGATYTHDEEAVLLRDWLSSLGPDAIVEDVADNEACVRDCCVLANWFSSQGYPDVEVGCALWMSGEDVKGELTPTLYNFRAAVDARRVERFADGLPTTLTASAALAILAQVEGGTQG